MDAAEPCPPSRRGGGGVHGEQLSLAARISHVADAAEALERRLGINGAVATIRDRRGTHFDPAVVDAIGTDPSTLFDGIADDSIDELLDLGAGGAATPERPGPGQRPRYDRRLLRPADPLLRRTWEAHGGASARTIVTT